MLYTCREQFMRRKSKKPPSIRAPGPFVRHAFQELRPEIGARGAARPETDHGGHIDALLLQAQQGFPAGSPSLGISAVQAFFNASRSCSIFSFVASRSFSLFFLSVSFEAMETLVSRLNFTNSRAAFSSASLVFRPVRSKSDSMTFSIVMMLFPWVCFPL